MKEHKYLVLAARLRADIHSGIYACGDKLPSENKLAGITGYSRQTVRQALACLEHEGLAGSIQGSGTYVQNTMQKREITNNIAVVTTYIGEYIFPYILQGIHDVLVANGYTSMLAATGNRVDNERRILSDFLHKPIDGLIIEGTKTALPNPNIDLYEEFKKAGIPIVFINGYYPELGSPVCVGADDRGGGRMACTALLQKGHRHIAGIFKSDDIQGHNRYAGYAEALRKAGLSVEDDHLMWYTTENRNSLLAATACEVLRGCTAVVCYNDEVTMSLIRILAQANIRVPQDMEIASFDNSTYAQLSNVPFLSLTNPKTTLGRLSAESMVAILHHKPAESVALGWSDAL